MHFFLQDNLEYICKLIFDTYKIPISLLDNKCNLVFELSDNVQSNPLSSLNNEVFHKFLLSENRLQKSPIFYETTYLENYFLICILSEKERFNGYILVGPTLYSKLPEESIKGILNDLQIKGKKEEMFLYYQSLPIISHLDFINMCKQVYYMMYQQKLDELEIIKNNKILDRETFDIQPPEIIVSERRQNEMVRIGPQIEKNIIKFIKEGRKFELFSMLMQPKEGKMGILSKESHLRSQKNLAISGITLAIRAAVEGGLHTELAYTLSDLFIQKLETLNDSKQVMPFTRNVFIDLAERVERGRKHRYSKPINICQHYIFTHLYNDISLSQLGNVVGMNPSYLSFLFKKEVGISLSEYIQKEKVKEAKNLMTSTNHSLTEISSLLNFHDQSHFSKVFKKIAGVTPKQFRNFHSIS